jgi:hypothetical protein
MLMGEPIIPAKIHPDSVPYAHALLFGTYPRHMVEKGKFSSNLKYYNMDGETAIVFHSGIFLWFARYIERAHHKDTTPGRRDPSRGSSS